MIIEDYVSFEIAKLLKEKGFDEKCQKVYTHNGQLLWAQIFMEGESFVDNKCIELVANYNNWITYTQGEYAYLCPTIQMAMKWLREVHNIHIELNWNKGNQLYSFQIWKPGKYQPETSSLDLWRLYKDDNYTGEWKYEETCEIAIKYCLKNLI